MLVPPADMAMIMMPALWAPQHVRALACTALLSLLLLTGGARYRTRLHISVLDELPFLLTRVLAAAAVVATVTALRHEQETVTSFLVVIAWVLLLVVAGRALTMTIVLVARRRGWAVHPTVLVGGGPISTELAEVLGRHSRYGLRVAGYLDDDPEAHPVDGVPWWGPVSGLAAAVAERGVDTILAAGGVAGDDELLTLIRCRPAGDYDLLVVPRLLRLHSLDSPPDHIGAIPVVHVNNPSLRGLSWVVKRGLDIAVAVLAVVLLAPVLGLCAAAVLAESGRPVLFRQQRVGTDGRMFELLKFRSMRPADGAESATRWSIARDPRVGPVGRLLRRTSLDELPQLWNIMRGDMTLVGPRPERPHFVEVFSEQIPGYRYRHRVRGGLTGLAQVNGLRGDTPIGDRARFDNFYIENWSLWMDAKIIFSTFREVLFARGR